MTTDPIRRPRGSECQCCECLLFFASTDAFDRHLAKVGCRYPGEVLDRDGRAVLELSTNVRGLVWRRRRDAEHPLASGRARQGGSQSAETTPYAVMPTD